MRNRLLPSLCVAGTVVLLLLAAARPASAAPEAHPESAAAAAETPQPSQIVQHFSQYAWWVEGGRLATALGRLRDATLANLARDSRTPDGYPRAGTSGTTPLPDGTARLACVAEPPKGGAGAVSDCLALSPGADLITFETRAQGEGDSRAYDYTVYLARKAEDVDLAYTGRVVIQLIIVDHPALFEPARRAVDAALAAAGARPLLPAPATTDGSSSK
ncbi:MAG: hypothetical protein HYV63_12205 [Candidatus Schekmanbacteria bacterium]|nr:hypothetical protein [Candidatus Schekmanbacteria bacterium]